MTGESIATKYGSESRPSRTHQHLLHPTKTDEIEVLESGTMNNHRSSIGAGHTNHHRAKVTHLYTNPCYFFVKRKEKNANHFASIVCMCMCV